MNKAQHEALKRIEELTEKTHQRVITEIFGNRVTVTLDDMVQGIIDKEGEVHWSYTKGIICDGCQHSFTPKVKET